MIAAAIFLLLFLVLLSMNFKQRLIPVVLFLISLFAIMLLFLHHATDALGINL